MKKWISLFILTQLIGWMAVARPCLSSCAHEDVQKVVPIHAELILPDKNICLEGAENSKGACNDVCQSKMGTESQPLDFLFSFFVNPFFTTSFLAPEECTAKSQNS